MISVIVPIYNAERFLSECLDSICRQTVKELEILLIDDGSTDSSAEICDRYARQDERIRVFRKENSGASDTRNFGIDQAAGEYIMFFDSDDYVSPDLCEKLLAAMTADGTDFAFCGYLNIATAKTSKRLLFDRSRTFFGDDYRREIRTATLGPTGSQLHNPEKLDKLTPIWARLYKSDIIRRYNIRYVDLSKVPSECLLFNFEYCLKAQSASYVNEALYAYRRNTGVSLTKRFRKGLWDKWSYWMDYTAAIISGLGDPEDYLSARGSRLCCSVIPLGGNAMKLPTRRERLAEMRTFLSRDAYRTAFADFDCGNCPVYWRLFFYAAKKRRVRLFYFLTWSMRKILDFRKK